MIKGDFSKLLHMANFMSAVELEENLPPERRAAAEAAAAKRIAPTAPVVVEAETDVIPLAVSRRELKMLRAMLAAKVPSLRHEIHHTDARALRDELRAELKLAERLEEKLAL